MPYMKDSEGTRLDSIPVLSKTDAGRGYVGPLASVPVTSPAGLLWDWTNYGFTASLTYLPDGRTVAAVSKKASDFFDAKSTARTAPVTTYYVNGSSAQTVSGISFAIGNDASAGTSAATALRSISVAQTKGNATGQPYAIIIAAGDYNRAYAPTSAAAPTVDCAFLAAGVVTTGTWDDLNFTVSGTAGTYTATVANAPVVCFTDVRTPDGHYVEAVAVTSAALVDSTPGSFYLTGSTLSVHHPNSVAVTSSNTRVFRNVSSVLALSNSVNVYIGGLDAGSGLHFQGSTSAVINANLVNGAVPTIDKVLAISGASARYASAVGGTTGRGFSGNGWRGLIVAENCDASANGSDGFNWHNGSTDDVTGVVTLFAAARTCRVLEINRSAVNNGRATQSCQGSTGHDDVVVISLGGRYERGHGATIRDIGNSQRWGAGMYVADDLGDRIFGGAVSPTAIQHDHVSEGWYDRVLVKMASGHRGLVATGTAKIHKRNCWPTPQPDYIQSGAVGDTY